MATVLVTASTGNVGKEVVKQLLASDAVAHVRAAGRDAAKTLAAHGGANAKLEAVEFDGSNDEASAKALDGVTAVYIIPPGNEDRGTVAVQYIDAIKKHGKSVKYVLLLSLVCVEEAPTILFARQFIPIEAAMRDIGITYTMFRAPFFAENVFLNVGSIKSQSKIYSMLKPETQFAEVHLNDLAEAAVKLLTTNGQGWENKTLNAFSTDPRTFANLAASFTKALNRQVDYVQVPKEAVHAACVGLGVPEWQAGGIVELFECCEAGKFSTDTSKLAEVLGRPTTTIDQLLSVVSGAFA